MVKLPPSSFPYNKYDSSAIPASIHVSIERKYLEWLRTQIIIGYIVGLELEIRPRTDSYGILFEDEEGYQSWCHIPNDILDAFLKENS